MSDPSDPSDPSDIPNPQEFNSDESTKNALGISVNLAEMDDRKFGIRNQMDQTHEVTTGKPLDERPCNAVASQDFKNSKPGSQEFTIKIPKLDLFCENNLGIKTKQAINFFLNPDNINENTRKNTPFIFGKYSLPEFIQNNLGLKAKLEEIVGSLETLSEGTFGEDDYPSKLLEIRTLLQEACNLMAKDKNIANSAFAKFIQGNIKAINVIVADALAKKVLQEIRSQSEAELSKTNTSTSISCETSAGLGPLTLTIGGSFDKKRGVGANFLYEISKTGSFSIGVGLKGPGDVLSLSVKGGGSLTHTALFFSIEQLLDSGNLKGTVSKETFEKLSERSKLQDAQKQLLGVMGSDVEGFLKMIGVVSLDVQVELPHITKSEAPMTSIAAGAQVAASVAVKSFTNFGLKVSKNKTETTYQKPHSFLSLLDDNCRPTDNLTAKDIGEIIGPKYDFSRKFLEPSPNEDVKILAPMHILLGDLHGYISILQELAAREQDLATLSRLKNSDAETVKKLKQDIKELTKKKHAYEDRLSPHKIIGREGRIGVLKTYVATLAAFNRSAKTEEETALCKKVFLGLKKLESLLEFSKNKKSRSGTFTQNANYTLTNSGVSGAMEVGKCSIECNYNKYSGSPLLGENGRYLSISVTIPQSTLGSLAIQTVKDEITKKTTLTGREAGDRIFDGLKRAAIDALTLTETTLPSCVKDIAGIDDALKVGPSVSSSTKVSAQSMWIKPNAHKRDSLSPLPGKKLVVKDSSYLVSQVYKAGTSIKAEIAGEIKGQTPIGVSVKGKASASHTVNGPILQILGTDTISYVLSKFNIWQMGVDKPTAQISTAWEAFKKNNKDAFSEILKNLAQDGSGPFYELQGLYNDILRRIAADTKKSPEENDQLRTQCTELFENLLKNCEEFKQGAIDLSEVLTSLEKVLAFNYEHNTLVHFNRAFSLHRKS